MYNYDVEKLLDRILIEFKDYNPYVYKETNDLIGNPGECPQYFDWHISLNNKYCISLSGNCYDNDKGKSVVRYSYRDLYYDELSDLHLTYISICIIDKNVTEDNKIYCDFEPIYKLEQIKSTYGNNILHDKYMNYDTIIYELKDFIEQHKHSC